MKPHIFGIYGFNFSQQITVGKINLMPLYEDHNEARKKAHDDQIFHLTGYGVIDTNISDFPWNAEPDYNKITLLGDAMTFCDQRWVITSLTLYAMSDLDRLPNALELHQLRPSMGPFIQEQAFSSEIRQNFLNLSIEKLEDTEFDQRTDFKKAFYRQIETIRLRKPYVEITYYLIYSALEILARKHCKKFKDVAFKIKKLLGDHDFKIEGKPVPLEEVKKWERFRNALFHNGQFEVREENDRRVIKHTEQDYSITHNQLSRLLPYILLKLTQYDDEDIAWNCWQHRQRG